MNPGRGILYKIGSTFFFTLMLVCVKAVADRIPTGETVFARSFFALVPIGGMLIWQGALPGALKTRRPWLHFSRGAVGVSSMALGFAALAFLPLPESMMISYASPLMIVALAAIVLGEPVRLFRWSAVALGFLGILIILWPRFTVLEAGADAGALVGALLALAAAFLSAVTGITVRSMTQTEPTGTIVFYFSLSSALFAVVVSLPFGWVVPGPRDAAILVTTGLLGGVGQILMTSAYREAGAATVASFEYVSMLWGLAFSWLFFSEAPTSTVMLGGAIVIAAGIVIILRERQLGIRERDLVPTQPPA